MLAPNWEISEKNIVFFIILIIYFFIILIKKKYYLIKQLSSKVRFSNFRF